MRRAETAKSNLVLFAVFLIPVVWAAMLTAPAMSGGFLEILAKLTAALNNPFDLVWVKDTPKCIFLFISAYALGIGIYLSTKRNYRRREEHGSARWGGAAAVNKKYRDKDRFQNKILTKDVCIGLNGRKHKRNLNVLVVGGSGSGKTRFYAKPNVMQANTSFVVLDPKGEILRDTGSLLKAKGYEIKVLDLINMQLSHCYNPFAYLQDDKDVLKLVTNLIRNTTPKGSNTNDPFWERSETALLEALTLYLLYEAPPEEQNFPMVMELIAAAEIREDDETYQSPLDELFERLEMREPEHLAVKQYNIFKLAAGKTAKSILISLGVRLEKFNLASIAGITSTDELELPFMGECKTALFAVIPDNDSSFNFIVGMLYTQLFQQLYFLADNVYGGRLPIHVHFVMDEFSNVALPDEFDKLLSTVRSREISVSIVLQNLAQLKALFKDSWESIVGNCDEFLYLGGNEQSTHKYVSELLGKETIDVNSYGQSRGRNGSYSTNYQLSGRELLTPDEVRMLDNRYALLFIRSERAVLDDKYDIFKHPNLKLTVDGGGEPYRHGGAENALDWRALSLNEESNYELLSGEELEVLLQS
ncbi:MULTISPECIES: VirD4-like conjugal transfer protein, CD1115 family [Dehalobacter]|jgi:type IV secretion system protein VirD4|uniref:TraM recognition domain-containing protein n=2 Tax=Dehalobacter restrictus TaxID=55583 RepID=A0A857DFG5_9FIRM|nr:MULTISPECIES: type IV secretory system conjugative DNA transfer family protein [Dehalobacter]AHF09027.1 conjugal transfer protein TraG [Dehalobacter restrictus DSM 9455]MCG1024970.1 type IV secretory system conjugative DNA transfer family protein [Dehalobacter sp.]QGZ99552.1 TraM recognition domain-containing protein [Dehalobacter restrictus]